MSRLNWILVWFAILALFLSMAVVACGDDDDDDDNDDDDDDNDDDNDDDDMGSAPMVTSSTPSDGAEQLKLATIIIVNFSESMDQLSVENALSITPSVTGSLSWNSQGDQMTYMPSNLLDDGTVYTLTISTGATDADGNGLQGDFALSFTTVDLWTYTSDAVSIGEAIDLDDEFNVYVAGGAQGNIWVGKFDMHAELEWTQSYAGAPGQSDIAHGLVVASDGTVYVAGAATESGFYSDIWLGKYDADGTEDWTKSYDGPGGFIDSGFSVATNSSNEPILCGFEFNPSSGFDIWTRQYNTAGTTQWTDTVDESTDDMGAGIATDAFDNYYVAGTISTDTEGKNIWLGMYDSLGDLQWFEIHNGADDGDDYSYGVALDDQGYIYVAGSEFVDGEDSNIWVRKYDTTANTVWTWTYGGDSNERDLAHGIAVDSEGNTYLTGYVWDDVENYNIWVASLDSDGSERWSYTFDHEAGADFAYAIACDEYGNSYVVGQVTMSGKGKQLWIRNFDSDGNWAL